MSTNLIIDTHYHPIPSPPNSPSYYQKQGGVLKSQSCPNSPKHQSRQITPIFQNIDQLHATPDLNANQFDALKNQISELSTKLTKQNETIEQLKNSNNQLEAIVMAAPPQLTWCEFAKKILLQFAVVVAGLLMAAALAIPLSLIVSPFVAVPLGMGVAFIFIMESTTKISNYYIDKAKERAIQQYRQDHPAQV